MLLAADVVREQTDLAHAAVRRLTEVLLVGQPPHLSAMLVAVQLPRREIGFPAEQADRDLEVHGWNRPPQQQHRGRGGTPP